MNIDEDLQLLGELEEKQLTLENTLNEVERLRNELTQWKQELKNVLEEKKVLSDIILRYRRYFKKFTQHPEHIDTSHDNGDEKSSSSSAPAKPKPNNKRKNSVKKTNIVKRTRVDRLIKEGLIKRPANSEEYSDVEMGRYIWDTIVRCFHKSPGGIVTEKQIIHEGGKEVFNADGPPFITDKKIDRYFRHVFDIADDDQTMQVRPVHTADSSSWVVLLPDWLNEEIKNNCLPVL